MNIEAFKASLSDSKPPRGISKLLEAMWYDGKGDWEMSHNIAQDIPSGDGSWIHAYLHRKEGDQGNAAYWYRRAGRPVSRLSLNEEWEKITAELLGKADSKFKI